MAQPDWGIFGDCWSFFPGLSLLNNLFIIGINLKVNSTDTGKVQDGILADHKSNHKKLAANMSASLGAMQIGAVGMFCMTISKPTVYLSF